KVAHQPPEITIDIFIFAAHQTGTIVAAHQRASTEPQGNPPPIASIRIRLLSLTLWASKASFNASGIDAAEVLPCLWSVITIFSRATPSLFTTPSRMRLLA